MFVSYKVRFYRALYFKKVSFLFLICFAYFWLLAEVSGKALLGPAPVNGHGNSKVIFENVDYICHCEGRTQ